MLMPILAAVGSFVVSERILKPKATALFVLACLALYDLFVAPPKPIALDDGDSDKGTSESAQYSSDEFGEFSKDFDFLHTQQEDDLAMSMRCYRGPALLAVALFCSAYSLRIWRRNGVACDELIFLPGTPHEFRCTSGNGAKNNNIDAATNAKQVELINRRQSTSALRSFSHHSFENIAINLTMNGKNHSDGGITSNHSGIFHLPSPRKERKENQLMATEVSDKEVCNIDTDDAEQREKSPLVTSRSWDNGQSSTDSTGHSSTILFIKDKAQSFALKGLDMLVVSERIEKIHRPLSPEISPLERLPVDEQISRENEVYDADYAPSGPSVLGAALDLSLPVLFNFHMFVVLMKDHYKTEAQGRNGVSIGVPEEGKIDVKDDVYFFTPPQLPPTVLPLIFLSSALVRSQLPRKQRQRFYKTLLQGTVLVPFKQVRFRDEFVGECMTSLVRPFVDVVFALTYYCAAIYGILSDKYDLKQARFIVSNLKLMHGVILPLCAILPLWCRFLQTLRQSFDTGKRWPYLGNSFKYLTAALVILYGMTHATGERGLAWRIAFIAATLYQIVWDTCMDWELLVVAPADTTELTKLAGTQNVVIGRLSKILCPSIMFSWRPRYLPSYLLGISVALRNRVSQPFANLCRRGQDSLPRLNQIRLRPQRMYDDQSLYWRALMVNAVLRFCWMMGFIPAYRISILDGSMQETFSHGNSWTFVILATLEIIRCCIWGIIKVELETIKLSRKNSGDENTVKTTLTENEFLKNDDRNTWHKHITNRATWETDSEELIENTQENGISSELEHNKDSMIEQHSRLCFGRSISTTFLKAAYLLELSLWPLSFLVLGYYVVLA